MDIPHPKYVNKEYIHLKEWWRRIFYFIILLLIRWNSTEVPVNMLAYVCVLLELSVFLLSCIALWVLEIKKPGDFCSDSHRVPLLVMHLVTVLFQVSFCPSFCKSCGPHKSAPTQFFVYFCVLLTTAVFYLNISAQNVVTPSFHFYLSTI